MRHSSYDNKRYFDIPEAKPSWSKFFARVDIEKWLDGENIQTVNFSAKNREDNSDVSTTILDQAKCTYNQPYILPYVQAGEEGARYRIKLRVQTVELSYEEFYIDFRVQSG